MENELWNIGKVSKLLLILILTYGAAIWIFIRRPGGRLKLHKTFCVRKTLNTKTIKLFIDILRQGKSWLDVSWMGVYFCFFSFQFQKREI